MSIANNLLSFAQRSLSSRVSRQLALNLARNSSTSTTLSYDKDPGPKFTDSEVQKLLKSITRTSLDKVFRKRSVLDNSVEYKFMTTEQLENEFKEVAARADEFLQMPPVVKVRVDQQKIISQDPALSDFSDSTFVICDITYGVPQSKRKIVIRQIDGTLEHAPQDIRKRINQIYFPMAGRRIRTPKMFEGEHLQRCLDRGMYEFVLDRLCIQYEPYEQDFHDIASKVYTHINETKRFDELRSTRHFGPMAFFYAWHNMIDDLLYDMIKRDYLRNGVELIALLYKLNNVEYDQSIHQKLNQLPESKDSLNDLRKTTAATSDDIHEEIKSAIGKSRDDFLADDICLEFIESFVKNRALKKVPLELAIQTFKETNDEKRKLYEGLKKAHGVN